jgi:hypothetical protein
MTITTTFTKTDQLDAEGKKVDDIYTITTTETPTYVFNKTLSGTEVVKKIAELEKTKEREEKYLLTITEEINFLKSLK